MECARSRSPPAGPSVGRLFGSVVRCSSFLHGCDPPDRTSNPPCPQTTGSDPRIDVAGCDIAAAGCCGDISRYPLRQPDGEADGTRPLPC